LRRNKSGRAFLPSESEHFGIELQLFLRRGNWRFSHLAFWAPPGKWHKDASAYTWRAAAGKKADAECTLECSAAPQHIASQSGKQPFLPALKVICVADPAGRARASSAVLQLN